MLPKVYLYRRIVQAKLFIDDHYHETIDLNKIAGEASFSKFHFIRLFKAIYGKTPHQYLIYVRLERAKILFQQGYAVSEVCTMVGFESITSFATLFKKYTRAAPSYYRQIQAQRKTEIQSNPFKFMPACFASEKGWLKK